MLLNLTTFLSRVAAGMRSARTALINVLLVEIPLYTRTSLYIQAIFILLCCVIWLALPIYTGYAIAALALAAVIMTVSPLTKIEKPIWILIAFALFVIELHVINNEHTDIERQHSADMKQQAAQFTQTLQEFSKTNANNSEDFSKTNQAEQKRFDALVKQDKVLFDHEEELVESTSGSLIPGTDPSPDTPCIRNNPGFALMFGDSTTIVSAFPFYVLIFNGKGLITLEKLANGSVVLVMDVRDRTGRIVARLDEKGYTIGSRLLFRKPDKSTLIVLDDYGEEALNIHYLNPNALSLKGYINFPDNKGTYTIGTNKIGNSTVVLGCNHPGPIPGASAFAIHR